MKRIQVIVGTRPNFIKITQFPKAFEKYKDIFEYQVVHTGQHYDEKMSDVFFKQFGFEPHVFLHLEPGSPNSQIAQIMIGLEKAIINFNPDLLIVVGDVNSTLAGALTANKMNVKIAHLESGLRSFDRTMPEEINRIITDELTDYFFVTEQSGLDNLIKEGKCSNNIFFVGNTMIDTLVAFKSHIDENEILKKYNLSEQPYVLMTMHRPATVDSEEGLKKLLRIIDVITEKYKIIFPIHPRTLGKLKEMNVEEGFLKNNNLILVEPLDYFSFQNLVSKSKFIITDSGGIQEESTFCGIPCLTLRPNTERPSTITIGTNELVPFDDNYISGVISEIEKGTYKKGEIPPMWDGKSSERIATILADILKS